MMVVLQDFNGNLTANHKLLVQRQIPHDSVNQCQSVVVHQIVVSAATLSHRCNNASTDQATPLANVRDEQRLFSRYAKGDLSGKL
jgi:hypothetical protein